MKVRCHPEAGRDILLYSCDTWLTKADADICLSFIIRPQMHFILRWIESHTFACTFALSSFFHIVLFALLTPCSSMPIVGIDVYRQWLSFAVDRTEKNQFRPELIHSNILHVQAILYYIDVNSGKYLCYFQLLQRIKSSSERQQSEMKKKAF